MHTLFMRRIILICNPVFQVELHETFQSFLKCIVWSWTLVDQQSPHQFCNRGTKNCWVMQLFLGGRFLECNVKLYFLPSHERTKDCDRSELFRWNQKRWQVSVNCTVELHINNGSIRTYLLKGRSIRIST